MIRPEIESVEVGERLIYVDPKTDKRYPAEVLEANAETGRVRIRFPVELDTSVAQLFRVGGKRRSD